MEKTMMLCYNRHTLTEEASREIGYTGESVFPHYFNPFDRELANACLKSSLANVTKLNLIVTGMSTAFQYVIRYCLANNIELICLHYNIKTDHYVAIPMSTNS